MNPSTHFADVAAPLVVNGYRPVPIKPGTKYPGFDGWQHFTFAPGCEGQYPQHGAGILLGDVVGFDIDVDDADAAAACEVAVREALGIGEAAEMPRRTGRAPRVMLPLRCAVPFHKIKSASYQLRSNGALAHVEVLAEGQQFVAYAEHPDTHRPYEWNGGGDLLTTPRDRLPEVDEAKAHELVRVCEAALEEWGDRVEPPRDPHANPATEGRRYATGGRNDLLTREAGKLRRLGLTAHELAAALQAMNRERCEPPLPESEVDAIARSIGRYEPHAPQAEAPYTWPPPLDLALLAQHEPERPMFLVGDMLPADYATLLAGHGGVGKSGIALYLAVCMVLELPFFGVPIARRTVLYLACEDREGILHWRLKHICRHLGVNLAALAGKLFVQDLVGEDAVLWERDPQTGMTTTPAFGRLRGRMAETDAQVLVVDGVSDTFAGNENARADVKRYVNALLALIPAGGALLLLGHVAKPAAGNPSTSEGYSGSTGWHNAVRARWYLYPETEVDESERTQRTGRLVLELQKSNHGPTGTAMRFAWDDAAHLFVGRPDDAARGLVDSIRERTEKRDVLRAIVASTDNGVPVPLAMQGPRTAYLVLSQRPEFPESLRGGGRPKTHRFARHIEAMRQIRHIEEKSMRRSNRHLVATLVPTSEGRAEYANS